MMGPIANRPLLRLWAKAGEKCRQLLDRVPRAALLPGKIQTSPSTWRQRLPARYEIYILPTIV